MFEFLSQLPSFVSYDYLLGSYWYPGNCIPCPTRKFEGKTVQVDIYRSLVEAYVRTALL